MGSSVFFNALAEVNRPWREHLTRQWQFVAYDQLNQSFGLLGTLPPEEVGIILCETKWKPSQRPYHKQKLLLLLASQRQFALEQARRGVCVRYIVDTRPYDEILAEIAQEMPPISVCEPAERELRIRLEPLIHQGILKPLGHAGWLTSPQDFEDAFRGKATWLMDTFYRLVRRRYGLLLDDDAKPLGGKWSHDADNRKPWRGTPPAPKPPCFEVDSVTAEVVVLIDTEFGRHPGRMTPSRIPATQLQVETYWAWVLDECMMYFGPYEDAMHTASAQLFHTRISGLLNLHRLMPERVLRDILGRALPLNSQEGFVRQVIGWREYVRHVHRFTDGFRNFQGTPLAQKGEQFRRNAHSQTDEASSLPEVFWGAESGLFCLDHAVSEVLHLGHTHHINRLMILANWGSLLEVSPRALTDWFWVGFDDAYDWVVEPNVLGMGTFALETLMITKPYVSGSGYVSKMSNYCEHCDFDPKKNCPMTRLYWAYLARRDEQLVGNPRMSIVRASLQKRNEARKAEDAKVFEAVRGALGREERLTPERLLALVGALT